MCGSQLKTGRNTDRKKRGRERESGGHTGVTGVTGVTGDGFQGASRSLNKVKDAL